MPYEQKISRQKPGLVVAVLDDSPSMKETLTGTSDARYLWVSRLFGIILKELLARSTDMKGNGVVIKPRYHLLVIRYGSYPEVWGGEILNIEKAVEKYSSEGGSLDLCGGISGTDTRVALELAYDHLKHAVKEQRFKDSFPPMVFHLSDGESHTDASAVAHKIMNLSTTDGNVLLANAYIGTQTNLAYGGPEDFTGYATESEAGPSEDNLRLFNMSSSIPASIRQNLISDGIFPNLRHNARLFFDVRTKEMLKQTIQVVGSLGSRADRTKE